MDLKKTLVIFVSALPFELEFNWTRQNATEISKKTKVLFVYDGELPQNVFKQNLNEIIFSEPNKNLYIYKPVNLIPGQRFEIISKINLHLRQFLFKTYIKIIKKLFSKQKVIIWFSYPVNDSGKYIEVDKKAFLVYDCTDNFSGLVGNKDRKELVSVENRLIKKVDIFLVNSPILKKYFVKERGIPKSKVHVVGSGYQIESFLKARKPKPTKIIKNIRKPIIGFAGSFTNRIDFKLVESLVKNNSDLSFVFLGDYLSNQRLKVFLPFIDVFTKGTTASIRRLKSYKNFILIKGVSLQRLPNYETSFDVCMIPYKPSLLFNLYSNPIKLYCYFALQKPVVSTPIKISKYYSKLVYVAKNEEDFTRIIKKTLKKKESLKTRKEKRRIAEQNNISSKIVQIEKILRYYK